jgi:16S rRNA (cytosine1402-N4)-methyltransferase
MHAAHCALAGRAAAAAAAAAAARRRAPLRAPRRRAAAAAAAATAAAAAAPRAAPEPHVPVLLEEVLSFFAGRRLSVYVDGTLGAGGHAAAVARAHRELRTIVGFDVDPAAHALAAARLRAARWRVAPAAPSADGLSLDFGHDEDDDINTDDSAPTAVAVRANFTALGPALAALGLTGGVDALLLDLGVSSMQLDAPARGFSFMRDGPLDMRMDPESGGPSAADIVNSWPEADLGLVLREYGEERNWKGVAARIAAARAAGPLETTAALAAAVGGRRDARGLHPATRTFQALRIAVNGELDALEAALPAAVEALAPGGRLAVITFHSLEDRIVKWAFREAAGAAARDAAPGAAGAPAGGGGPPRVRILTRRPVVPGAAEEEDNPRSRSAKLRVVEKL